MQLFKHLIIPVLSLLTCLTACSSNLENGPPVDLGVPLQSVHVARATVQDSLHASETGVVALLLELRPVSAVNALGGAARPYAPLDMRVELTPDGGEITLFPFRRTNEPDGAWKAETREITYTLPHLPAGKYTLSYFGAPTREETGILFLKQSLFDKAETSALTRRFTQRLPSCRSRADSALYTCIHWEQNAMAQHAPWSRDA